MKLYCVIGDERVNRSLSPVMHNSVFSLLGMDSVYIPVNVKTGRLEKAVYGIRFLGFSGANVTVPHKERIIPYLDGLSEEAYTVGAVNTLVFDERGVIGHNTDIGGFGDLLDYSGFRSQESMVVLIGAGGAARAVISSLESRGLRVTVVNRTLEKAVRLTQDLGGSAASFEELPELLKKAGLLINTSAVSDDAGDEKLVSIINDVGLLTSLKVVIDVNYGRTNNIWSRLAERNSAVFHDGLYMLAAQAQRSFCLWTGSNPELDNFLRPLGFNR